MRPYDTGGSPDTFAFRTPSELWWILPNGTGGRLRNDTVTPLDLSICLYCFVERLVVVGTEPAPILIVQETDMESGGSFVVRLEAANLSILWKLRTGGFNLATPLRIADTLYVAAFDFVGKLDLSRGRFHWSHENLYRTRQLNAFDPPILAGDTIVFAAEKDRSLRVLRSNGRIVN